MADEKKEVAPVATPTPATNKILTYHGPHNPIPSIGNLPGLPAYQTKKANMLTPEEIDHVKATVPAAANWWR